MKTSENHLLKIRELLTYDPSTGEFRHALKRRGVTQGSLAGVISNSDGYRYIKVDGERYSAHRLAWFFVNGEMPKYEVGFLDKSVPSPLRERADNLSMTDLSARDDLTAEALKKLFHYDPATGIFTQKTARRGVTIGNRAGSVEPNGYRLIRVRGKDYGANRLAWLYMHGNWPDGKVMYRNGDGDDCRIENLYQEVDAYTVPELRRQRDRKDRKENPEKYRVWELKKNFGISAEEYAAKLLAQNGVCEICKLPETAVYRGRVRHLAVDHNHSTGGIRDLLCHACNLTLGHSRESSARLRAIADYLDRHEVTLPANVVPLRKEPA